MVAISGMSAILDASCVFRESVVRCDLQVTTDRASRAHRRAAPPVASPEAETRPPMSILDDLSSAIRTVHDSAGPAVVGIGQRHPRQRRRHRRRSRPDQCPQPPRRRGHRHLPRRSIDAWQGPRRRSRRRSRRDRGRHDRRHAARLVRRRGVDRRRRLRPRVDRCRRGPRHRRHESRPSSRRSGVPVAAGSVAASSTRRRWRRARPAARSSTAAATSSGSTPTGSARASTWRVPRTQPCASESMPCRAASRSAGRGSASRSRRRPSHGASVARSG